MSVIRVTLAVLAAAALAATLALLAMAAPAASKQHAATGAYCPDKTSRQHDAAVAHKAVLKATKNVKLKTKALAKAKKTHKKKVVAKAQKNLRIAKGRAADARAEAHDANAALADC
jgi:membrane-bound lytic murein transglycosylase B